MNYIVKNLFAVLGKLVVVFRCGRENCISSKICKYKGGNCSSRTSWLLPLGDHCSRRHNVKSTSVILYERESGSSRRNPDGI